MFDKNSGDLQGLVGPWFPKGWPEPEVSWHLLARADGKGYAYEAANAVLVWLFGEMGWDTAVSLVADENAASIRLAQRLGAKPEGLFSHQIAGDQRIWRHDPAQFTGGPDRRRLQ